MIFLCIKKKEQTYINERRGKCLHGFLFRMYVKAWFNCVVKWEERRKNFLFLVNYGAFYIPRWRIWQPRNRSFDAFHAYRLALTPNTKDGDNLSAFETSVRLTNHCLKSCQKEIGFATSPEKMNKSLLVLAKSALPVIFYVYFGR